MYRRIGVLLCLLIIASPLYGDWNRWLVAYKRGDYASVLKETQPLAKQYDHDALFWLGLLHEEGKGVKKNDEQAFKYYSTLRVHYIKCHPLVPYKLAYMYFEGRGIKQDTAKAVFCLQDAAELGHADSQTELGFMYRHGKGVDQDFKEALKWYHKAAAQEDAFAQSEIGVMYKLGEGVPQNYIKAIQWFQMSTESRSSRAMMLLGLMYLEGNGVIQNYIKAHMWCNLAAAHGDTSAHRLRDQVASYMTNDQIAKAQDLALEWMEKHKDN